MPEGIRTPDPRLRRPLLYPAELQTHLSVHTEKRVMGIEPTYLAWKASVLPLNYTRIYAETVMLLQQSGWQDSNLRPPGPKPGALAKLSHTPMSYNIISMKLSFLVLSRISFLSLKARVIILYGLPFVNTFFINFYIFFEKSLDKDTYFVYNLTCTCGCSSPGRAQPCQGWGSEFEPRHPLHKKRDTIYGISFFI